jgi:hypothetical protein
MRKSLKNFWSTEEVAWGLASSHRVSPKAEATDPGRWWVPEEVGQCLQRDDSPCHAMPAWQEGHCCEGQGCTKNPKMMDICEGVLGKCERKQRYKGLRCKTAAMSATGIGIIGQSGRHEPLVGSKEAYIYGACGQTHELGVTKHIVCTSIILWKMSVRTLWKGWPLLKQERLHAE